MAIIILVSFLVIIGLILWTIKAAPKTPLYGELLSENLKVSEERESILFVGDSNVKGEFSGSFIQKLLENSNIQSYQVVNGGRNFETIPSLLQRLSALKHLNFDYIFILVGTFDVAVGQGGPLQLFQSLIKGQRSYTDKVQFENEYRALIKLVKSMTKKEIVLLTLPTLGESVDGWGQEKTIFYSNLIREIATSEKCGLIDLNKSLQKKMFGDGDVARISRDFDGGWISIETYLRYYFLWEKVTLTRRRTGMRWTTDLLHMNKKSADFLASMIAQYIITRRRPTN